MRIRSKPGYVAAAACGAALGYFLLDIIMSIATYGRKPLQLDPTFALGCRLLLAATGLLTAPSLLYSTKDYKNL